MLIAAVCIVLWEFGAYPYRGPSIRRPRLLTDQRQMTTDSYSPCDASVMSADSGSDAAVFHGRDDLLDAVQELLNEIDGGPVPRDWENATLEQFLDAFAALLGSIENHYVNTGSPIPDNPWVIVAEVMRGTRYYE